MTGLLRRRRHRALLARIDALELKLGLRDWRPGDFPTFEAFFGEVVSSAGPTSITIGTVIPDGWELHALPPASTTKGAPRCST